MFKFELILIFIKQTLKTPDETLDLGGALGNMPEKVIYLIRSNKLG